MAFADDYEELYARYKQVKNELRSVYDSLSIMDMLLDHYSYDLPKGVRPFQSTKEMAEFFKNMLHIVLPKEYHYKAK